MKHKQNVHAITETVDQKPYVFVKPSENLATPPLGDKEVPYLLTQHPTHSPSELGLEQQPEEVAILEGLDPATHAKYRHKGLWYYQVLAKREALRDKRVKRPNTRLNSFEKDSIAQFCCELYTQGFAEREIKRRVAAEFKLTDYFANQVVKNAKSSLKELDDKDIQHQRTMAVRRLEDLYQRAIKDNAIKMALAIQTELNSLLGLAEPKKNDVFIQMKPVEQMTNAELEILLGSDKKLLNA